MGKPWVSEKGPTCKCGGPTIVTGSEEDGWVLMCIIHTKAEGAFWDLPPTKPDDLPDDPEKWPDMLFA